MDELVQMPNVLANELAVRIIDSDKNRLKNVQAMVQTMLPSDVEVTAAQHPEEVRRQLELLSSGDPATYTQRKHNIFLTRENFTSFHTLHPGDNLFKDARSVKNTTNHDGTFAMLDNYKNYLLAEDGKFFNAVLVDPTSTEANPQTWDPFEPNIHLANFSCPHAEIHKDPQLTKIQIYESDDESQTLASRMQLEKMFLHFDRLIEMDSWK